MANSLGTLTPGKVVQRALELVFTKRPVLNYITLDVADKDTGSVEAKFNETIKTRIITIPTVNNFGTGAGNATTTDVPVTLDTFKEVHLAFTPQEYSGTSRNLLDEFAEPVAIAIGNHLVDAVASLWLAASFAQTTVASGWNYTNTIVPVRTALQTRGVPEMQRFFLGNASVYGSFLTDSLIVAYLNNQSNANAIQTGRLPNVSGFGLDEYPALPTTGNMVAFAGSKDSTVCAVRVPKNPEDLAPGLKFPGTIETITEPVSGLSVMLNQWIDPDTLNVNHRVLLMYGKAVGNTNNGQIVKTA